MFYSYHNRYQIQSIAIAGATISLAVGLFQPAQAASVTYDFNVTITNTSGVSPTSIGEVFSGWFSYDDELPNSAVSTVPYYDVTGFEFNYLNTTYTLSDLYFDGRQGPASSPLNITGGEAIFSSAGAFAIIPRGGELQSFRFSSFSPFRVDDYFTIVGSQNPTDSYFNAGFLSNGRQIGSTSGAVNYALRTESIPEPDGTLGLMAALGFGWFLKRRFAVHKH